jgi:cytidylate kinase
VIGGIYDHAVWTIPKGVVLAAAASNKSANPDLHAKPAPVKSGAARADLPRVIAIDGPAGAGKSTVGRLLAARLGYLFFDTGAMYRAVTWAALRRGVDLDGEDALSALAHHLDIQITIPTPQQAADGRAYNVLVDGEDVTWAVREPDVEAQVSTVSAHGGVREALVVQQRRVAQSTGRPAGPPGIVMAGRDIGTVVLPEADLKIYLDASAVERARRRAAELAARGQTPSFAEVLAEIERRDYQDSSRAVSPLRRAEDAVLLVTDGLAIEQTMERVMRVVNGAR